MKPAFWRAFAVALAASLAIAGVGGALTELGPWYFSLKQPAWKPPDYAFGIIWSTIFTLCAFSAAIAWSHAPGPVRKRRLLVLFLLNGALNMLWSLLYFKLHRPDWAMWEWALLWLSVLSLVLGLRAYSRLASWLNVPYLLWVSAAGLLNWQTIVLNGPFG
ncbi:TspO protein [Rhodoferax lacus]|uniref:TspO protein n=1 Tax=Rhodoferax lacus TaxID=2184758 RepID=A0A3E1RCH9_9BURK|nr:TspO/MBR family protein [Rhodoferax lacus]RFO97059.1 TspO protein [Rhodoferax lacus]